MPIRRRVVYADLSFDLGRKLSDRNQGRVRRGLVPEKPPKREMFVELLEEQALVTHPIYQIAPLSATFREVIAKQRAMIIQNIRMYRGGEPEALILQPQPSFFDAWRGLSIPDRNECSFTRLSSVPGIYTAWIGMSRNWTWVSSRNPEQREKADVPGLALYVNLLEGLDENGAPLRQSRQGPIPGEDVEALNTLAP